MGAEATCVAHWQGRTSAGKALLESDHLLFRGEFRLKVPFAEVRDSRVDGGRLVLVLGEGEASFELGAKAERWLQKLRNPPTLLDKLGVKPGMRVSVLGVDDGEFLERLQASGADVSTRLRKESDLVFLQADSPERLERIAALAPSLKRDGGAWVVTPRGVPALADVVVMRAARAAGLVDVKVARFSETHTALKLVIPKTKR